MSAEKVYLGDSVYADVDDMGFHIVLTTENGMVASNVIYLEPAVYAELVRYATRMKAEEKLQ